MTQTFQNKAEAAMPRRYVTLDVFTSRPLGGNPLAVVLDAAGLDDAAMQHITREFNLSETVFVLPPRDPSRQARIRIFTTVHELPFAGHPTVGAAVLLALENKLAKGQFQIEEQIGPVRWRGDHRRAGLAPGRGHLRGAAQGDAGRGRHFPQGLAPMRSTLRFPTSALMPIVRWWPPPACRSCSCRWRT